MIKKLLAPALAGGLTMPVLIVWRGYPWPLALVTALAIGALVFVGRRSADQLRRTIGAHRQPWRIEPAADPSALPAQSTPGPDQQRGGQQQVGEAAGDEPDEQQEEPAGEEPTGEDQAQARRP